MLLSCSTVPPLTPTDPMSTPSTVSGRPPPNGVNRGMLVMPPANEGWSALTCSHTDVSTPMPTAVYALPSAMAMAINGAPSMRVVQVGLPPASSTTTATAIPASRAERCAASAIRRPSSRDTELPVMVTFSPQCGVAAWRAARVRPGSSLSGPGPRSRRGGWSGLLLPDLQVLVLVVGEVRELRGVRVLRVRLVDQLVRDHHVVRGEVLDQATEVVDGEPGGPGGREADRRDLHAAGLDL